MLSYLRDTTLAAVMDYIAKSSASGLFALCVLFGAPGVVDAQRGDDTARSPGPHGAAGQQSVTGTEAPRGTAVGPSAGRQPRGVPIGKATAGSGDKTGAGLGKKSSSTPVPQWK
jgi:hypothetical protein